MAIVATNLKRGQCIKYEGDRGVVLGLEHRTPGKGNALIAATIRSFNTGKTKTIRFSSSEKVDIVDTDRQKLEFSYAEPGIYNFMDMQTFDNIALADEFVGDAKALGELCMRLFGQRRKQLGTILGRETAWPAGITPQMRAEQLGPAQFIALLQVVALA